MKIWAKTKEFCEGKFLVVRRDGSVPHWPHFVLGARDPFAAHTLRSYAYYVKRFGGDTEYANSIAELADDFDDYRAAQGNGDPEAPPHREDNMHVIDAMRGLPAIICVVPDKGNVAK